MEVVAGSGSPSRQLRRRSWLAGGVFLQPPQRIFLQPRPDTEMLFEDNQFVFGAPPKKKPMPNMQKQNREIANKDPVFPV
jgi:hypothetical protein